MLREPRRLIASVVAIAAGVAFVAATLVLSATLTAVMDRSYGGTTVGSTVIVEPDYRNESAAPTLITQALLDDISKVPGVTRVRAEAMVPVLWKHASGQQDFLVTPVPQLSDRTTLIQGRLPTAAGEVLVNDVAATARSITVGQKLALMGFAEQSPRDFTVVGIVKVGPEIMTGSSPAMFATAADLTQWRGQDGYDQALVYGGDPVQVRDAIKVLPSAKAGSYAVKTTADYLADARKEMAEIMRYVTGFLLSFGVIALVVSALVIANTFSILVAQRTRQLALLRCVGATRGQVFRTVVGESLLMGAIGAVLGVAGGIALAFGLLQLVRLFGATVDAFVVPPEAIIVPSLLALLVTLTASLMPARRATRVMPLAALRPNLVPSTGTRSGRAVLGTGAVLLAAGVAALVYGAVKPGMGSSYESSYLVVGIVGGLASFVGVLLLGTLVIPAVARVVGVVPAAIGGVPGRLAVENSHRNPSRAAATCSALLIGVTLLTTVAVGAQSGTTTQQAAFDRLFPADLMVMPMNGTVSDAMVTKVQGAPSVRTVARASEATLTVAGKEKSVSGLSPAMREVLRDPDALAGLADDTILVPRDAEIAEGARVTVTGSRGTRTLRAVHHRGAGTQVTMATFEAVSSEGGQSLWLRLKDDASASVVAEQLSQDLAADGVQVSGGALAREQMQSMVNIVVGVVAGLLAVSVLIALIGITNTLGLSVLERTQESGLLRALGLTAGKLKAMFAIEAVILAAVAVVLGLGLGILYGVTGTYALLKGSTTVVLDMPWAWIAGIAGAAVAAGLVASVVPAIRAGRVKPAAALAVAE